MKINHGDAKEGAASRQVLAPWRAAMNGVRSTPYKSIARKAAKPPRWQVPIEWPVIPWRLGDLARDNEWCAEHTLRFLYSIEEA